MQTDTPPHTPPPAAPPLWRSPVVVAAVVVALGLLLHAIFPRYEATNTPGLTVDRWTGASCYGMDGCKKPQRQSAAKPSDPFDDLWRNAPRQ
jgi:hypothetical protein